MLVHETARIVSLLLAIVSVAGVAGSQSPLPRTADGHPDLLGTWLNDTMTPLARPEKFAAQAFFSPEEAAEFEKNFDSVESNAARLGAVDERVLVFGQAAAARSLVSGVPG